MSATWINAIPLEDLKARGTAVVRSNGKQIALFGREQGVLACNNRCPHEGYPLSEGSVDEHCVLTCNWHSWKFDLTTGENLYRGDKLRTYPVEVRGGDVWIDVSDPPPEVVRQDILTNLRNAFDDHDYERLAREIGRWQLTGGNPVEIIKHAITWSYDRFEFGWTHAYAAAADWLRLYDEHEGDVETQLICVLEVVGHIADDGLRESVYPFPESGKRELDEVEFLSAIEEEDEPGAIAMVRGALKDGSGFAELEGPLTRAALAHYNDFGHSLIYVNKVGYLIGRIGDEAAEPLLLSLVRSLVFASREDLIPKFRDYGQCLAQWGEVDQAASPSASDFRRLGCKPAFKFDPRSASNSDPR